jgi:hypothetical protein
MVTRRGRGPEPEREDREAAEPERERQRWRPGEDVVRGDPQHLPGVPVRDDQQVAVEVHGGLGPAGGAAGEAEQRDVVAAGSRRLVPHLLVQCRPVQLGVVVGGAVEAEHLGQEPALLGARDQLVHQPGVAQRERDLGDVDDLGQLAGPQHRHRVHHHRAGLGGRQPARDHRRVVRRADQHPVAGLHPEVLGEGVGQPVRPVGELLVGAAPAVADQRRVVAETALHHAIGELDRDIEVLGVVEPVQHQLRPELGGRQVVAGEAVDVAAGAERLVHGITAVASISTLASGSSSPATCTSAIAG